MNIYTKIQLNETKKREDGIFSKLISILITN